MKRKIVFWPSTDDLNLASQRIRCFDVVNRLKAQGLDVSVQLEPRVCDVLVLSKRYDNASIERALNLKQENGTKIVLDICDNFFYFDVASSAAKLRAMELKDALTKADLVTCSSEFLAEQIGLRVSTEVRIRVVEDFVDRSLSTVRRPFFLQSLSDFRTLILNLQLASSGRTKFLWFGNSGGNFARSGISAVESILDVLNTWNAERPISLTILSNSRRSLSYFSKRSQFPIYYASWNARNFEKLAVLHDCCLLPVDENPFTYAKSANRLTSCLKLKIPVLATGVPSYLAYSRFAFLDPWNSSISDVHAYMKRANLEPVHQFLENMESEVLDKWITTLESV